MKKKASVKRNALKPPTKLTAAERKTLSKILAKARAHKAYKRLAPKKRAPN